MAWYLILGYLINGVIFGFITKNVADSKGLEHGFAWGFWFGLVGLLVVGFKPMVTSPPQRQDEFTKECPHCGAPNKSFAADCSSCGQSLKTVHLVRCNYCGRMNAGSNGKCFACGNMMGVSDKAMKEM